MAGELDVALLLRIEEKASLARRTAVERMADFGLACDGTTDLRHIATMLTGGPVEAEQNLEVDGERLAGLLVWREAGASILYEAHDPPVRQRFSIAHELGHLYLHVSDTARIYRRCPARSVDPDDAPAATDGTPPPLPIMDIEAEADAFAGAFLLPADDFREALGRYGQCDAFLAHMFGVSEATVRRRSRSLARLAEAGQPGTRRPEPSDAVPAGAATSGGQN